MAETINTDFADEIDSSMPSENRKSESAPEANSNGYVAVDVANLSLLAAVAAVASSPSEFDFTAGPRAPVKKSLSRKGSQRGERKAPESAAGAEISALLVRVAGNGEEGTLRLVTNTTAGVAGAPGRCRRLAFRRPAPWLDPRRVLVFFATLSSVGTLILLYFTLFKGSIKPGSTDGNVK